MSFIKIQFFIGITMIFLGTSIQAQTVSGKVIDGEKYKAIPFASIAIEGTTLGTVTNFEGIFSFEIPAEYIENQLIVSCVGFKERKFEIIEIYGNNNLEIELEAVNVEIDEVVVEKKSLLPYTILKKAIGLISKNYINIPYNYKFYYSNIHTTEFNKNFKREAIVLMYDNKGYYKTSVYNTFKSINYMFLESKRNFDVLDLNDANTNIDDLLEFDIVRQRGNILDEKRIYDFDIVIKDEINYKGNDIWVLSYSNKKPDFVSTGDFSANFYSGEIFIKKDDYAVLYNKTTVKTNNHSTNGRNIYVDPTKSKKNAVYSFGVSYKTQKGYYILDKIDYKIVYNNSSKISSVNVLELYVESPHEISSRAYYEDLDYDASSWAEANKFKNPE